MPMIKKTQTLVREATAQDAAAVVRLVRQMGDGSDITEEYVLHYISGADRGILIAQHEDAVAGLLSYSARADLFHAGNSVFIEELIVDEKCRGLGIGGALLDRVTERAGELHAKELSLAVMPDNADAIRLYKKHGLLEEALFLERHF